MTASIDKRIVGMEFDNTRFEKPASETLSTLDKLKKSLNFGDANKSFSGITDAASKVNLGGIGDAIGGITKNFSAMGVLAITTLVNIANAAYQAGVKIVKALTIDPITTGLNEYETKLNAVQTILANTQKEGTNLAIVTDALNTLNAYADKTIYNFQQMTRNVGTFTASGVKLADAVASIKGIANLAALSGSNAEQASTAMYQLSQALSTGTLRLQDWNSVVNAGLGGQVFQDALKETARLHGVAVDQMIKEEGSFRESLQRGWITSQILSETLAKFTGDLNADQLRTMGYTEDQITSIIKMAQTANDAATKVKTFTQLFDTLKEAAQSGWAQTWEIIIGDFNEAKSFLTDLNNWFGSVLGASADARNTLLQNWKDLGGRTALIMAFQNALNAIVKVINPIKEGMKEIFPPVTAQALYTLSLNIRRFTENLIISGETANKIKKIFKGVFALFDIGKMAVVAIAKEFGRLLKVLFPMADGLGGILEKLADFIIKVRDSIKANNTFAKVMKVIGDTILLVGGVIGKGVQAILTAVNKFKDLNKTEGFLKSFSGAMLAFFDFFKKLDFSFITGILDRIKERLEGFGKIGDFLKKAFANMGKGEKKDNPYLDLIESIKNKVVDAIKNMVLKILEALNNIDFKKFSFKGLFDTLNAGLLSGLLLSIIRFVSKGNGLFGTIVDIFKGISGFAENANGILASITTVMTGVKDILTAWQQQIRAGILLKIAGAIGILALSLIALSLVDSEKLTGALAAITGLFADLMGSLALYEKVAGGTAGIPAMAKGVGAMIGLSVAVLILSGALVNLASVPTKDIIKGITAITTLTALLVATSIVLSKNATSVITGAGSIIIFSLALRSLIGPVKTLGDIEPDKLTRGLSGLGVLMVELVAFMKTVGSSTSALDDVIAIAVLALAINDLGGIITKFANQDTNALTKGLTVMGIILAQLMAFTKITAAGGINFVTTAAGMLVLGAALYIIGNTVESLGNLSWKELAVGLTGLGGSLLILGVALNAMTGGLAGAAAIFVAALALAILVPPLKSLAQLDIKQVGIALLALAGVFTVFGLAGYLLTPVVPILIALAASIGIFGLAVLAAGLGVGAFAAGLALLATVGVAAGGALGAVLISVAAVLPLLAAGLALAIISFAKVLTTGAPILFEAGKVLLAGLIGSVTESMPLIVGMILTGIDTLLTKVTEKLPSIIKSGYEILLAFMSGLANNIGGIATVAADIITRFLTALNEKMPALTDAGWNTIITFIDSMSKGVEDHLPALMTSVQELGLSIVKGIIQGLLDGRQQAIDAIKDIGRMLIESFKERLGIHSPSSVFWELALQMILGLVGGIKDNLSTIAINAIKMGQEVINAVQTKVGEAVTAGKNFVIGFANGIGSYISTAVKAAGDLGKAVLDGLAKILDSHSPSRATFKLGKFADQGMAGGITSFAGLVLQATKDLGTKTIDGFSSIIGQISDAVNSNIDANPTIRPVLDLSDIEAGGSKLNGLLGGKSLNLSLTAAKVSGISVPGQASVEEAVNTQQTGTAPAVTFIQNNTSPKALSPVEIYRQTKNQLSIAKGMVGV